MRRAVIWLGIILAALLACGPLVAGPPYAGATAEQYDWQGTWESSYKKEITGPSFPWAFTRIKDAFQANFSFSMDARARCGARRTAASFIVLNTMAAPPFRKTAA